MSLELWQVPLLVIVGIVVVEAVARMVLRRLGLGLGRIVWAVVLAVAGLVLIVLFLLTWPPVGASAAVDIIGMLTGVGSLWLGYLTYRDVRAGMTEQTAVQVTEPRTAPEAEPQQAAAE